MNKTDSPLMAHRRGRLCLSLALMLVSGAVRGNAAEFDATAAEPQLGYFVPGTTEPPGDTVAQWTFDEPEWLYPSHVMDSTDGLDAPLVLGLGGRLVPGRFGNALSTLPGPDIEIPREGEATASLQPVPVPAGRTMEPLTWRTAGFAALMTSGERHVRKEVSFANPTTTALNLGSGDWTVEFWFRVDERATDPGVIFEIGRGPRGENDEITRLQADPAGSRFIWENQPTGVRQGIEATTLRSSSWHHYALVHAARAGTLQLFVDGRPQLTQDLEVTALPAGEEAYLSLGRDGRWERPMPGVLDELRFSRETVYRNAFDASVSLAPPVPSWALESGPALLFASDQTNDEAVPLGTRKHVFIDAALLAKTGGATFTAHPPLHVRRVVDGTTGMFRKHLTVVEDDDGLIRIYNGGPDDRLMVHVSEDGLKFRDPDTGIHFRDRDNIVIAEAAPLGRPIIDPQGPPELRWKYVSGLEGRGVYLYTSPDGRAWRRWRTAVLPFRSGSQSSLFYDDQRQLYVGYQRTGFPQAAGGGTRREFVRSETADLMRPWPVVPQTQAELREIARTRSLRAPIPWWLDNGPLTPGDFGIELPTAFAPDETIDPPGSGVYVPKATKYPWAPDTYVAFPVMYFDYEQPAQPLVRQALMDPARGLGSGTVETQLAVSRDGVHWARQPRPTYVGIGEYEGKFLNQIYMAEGMVRRGNDIWQYFYGQEDYHSPYRRKPENNGIYRVEQRLDGFVSLDAPYDRLITLETRLLTFNGRRLELNIDTGALGYAQVELADEAGQPIPGYSFDDCVYINANRVNHGVEWLGSDSDLAALANKIVRLRIRMRGASLYALQFVE